MCQAKTSGCGCPTMLWYSMPMADLSRSKCQALSAKALGVND
ncbi:hypothetical protein I553_2004 [Mycobacterium xenopi 4042]|uniref:Uncharacterized protein n=1 Tax=Mycobacterium xenopi 4042 TaxID=1299334 RepID=X8DLB8_MYCXE|nr:hypothetical protein I553_2004 [Mycobacterium xenopi 4042]